MTETPKPESKESPPAQPVTAVTAPKPREIRTVEDHSAVSYLMDTARFEHCYRIAGAMARASLIPRHLKGETYEQTQANCFLVVNQALRWNLDPFAVAPETYEVGGKLGFQGKLIAAVINSRAGLIERLSFTFNGMKGDALEVTVSGRLVGEEEPRTVKVSVGQVKTKNDMWIRDPEQKLVYTGAIRWARRHKPEVILGVLTDDDAELMREEARFVAARAVARPPIFEPAKAVSEYIPNLDEATSAQAAQPEPEPAPQSPEPSAESKYLKSVRLLAKAAKLKEGELLDWLNTTGAADGSSATLDELPVEVLQRVHDHWKEIITKINELKGTP